ncbi:hypothetical protein EDC14_10478 [Hydrogenispora ethanolica]|uniref:Uncharacterized protein n=1 Tax=Hydrogenispora ethanolica TaxID=1082276 RepID=A0A4R1QWG0_HYDET|nr:hypothetical protein [Hydrogenispora ethanolica]TCL57105.1 hypothetical protein EDC14_10478 [Hydrogenispora ethanolica]
MADVIMLQWIDRILQPERWYEVADLNLEGYCMIATKEDQRLAGTVRDRESGASRSRQFGRNPFKPYRDYYGKFRLTTRLLPESVEVKFAVGYTLNSKVVTVDDYSNLGWLRLATGVADMLYPNLSDQKQLLQYIIQRTTYPRFVTTRVYHYLQNELYRELAAAIKV